VEVSIFFFGDLVFLSAKQKPWRVALKLNDWLLEDTHCAYCPAVVNMKKVAVLPIKKYLVEVSLGQRYSSQ
jgi:hypothetical protein